VSDSPDDLLGLAASVGDGTPLDWAALHTTHRDSDPALLRELQIIASVAEVHRETATRWGDLLIKEEIGSGSFGRVFRAHDPRLERDVALKLYSAAAIRGSSRFHEGRLLARVRHPNVVAVYGMEERGEEVGLWLELLDGVTLAEYVRTAGPVGYREAALVGQDVCRALAAVHQAGLVHGDVKAQNVMRERGGRIVLMDFGIGRDLRAPQPESSSGGTPLYMAPELFDGAPATSASDIYGVGVLLFLLVTGSYPIVASDRKELERRHRAGQRRLLRDVRHDLPDAFVDVIERACATTPDDRYQTAGAMQAALARAAGLSSDSSSASDARASTRRFARSRFQLAALAILLLLATSSGYLWWRRTPSAAPSEPTSSAANPPTREAGSNPATASVGDQEYRIGASFYRRAQSGPQRLLAGSRIAPGDQLYLEITASRPIHVYVVNQDDRGESYLLFPLPGQTPSNPLPPGRINQVPGAVDWKVTSAGGREHFLIVASTAPLASLETVFAALPRPDEGRPVVTAAPLDDKVLGQLRGIGGLTLKPSKDHAANDLLRSALSLTSQDEIVKGPWLRQFTLENPGR
jgi:serine/threonine protein kinase